MIIILSEIGMALTGFTFSNKIVFRFGGAIRHLCFKSPRTEIVRITQRLCNCNVASGLADICIIIKIALEEKQYVCMGTCLKTTALMFLSLTLTPEQKWELIIMCQM